MFGRTITEGEHIILLKEKLVPSIPLWSFGQNVK